MAHQREESPPLLGGHENDTDEELVLLTLANHAFFALLVRRYEERLRAYVRRIVGANPHDAEDIVQEVFLKAYVNLNDFDRALKFSSWLYRIAHNHAISTMRKRSARPQCIQGEEAEVLWETLASDFDGEAHMDKKLTREQVRRVLDALDPRYRAVLVLRYLEEREYTEIADILQKPMGTVATLLYRAKRAFEKQARSSSAYFKDL